MTKRPLLEAVKDWTEKQRKVLNKTTEISIRNFYAGLTKDAPVFTGRFVFNFRLTEDSPSDRSNLNYVADRQAAMLFYQAEITARNIHAGAVYYITNTVVYAEWIEYNHPWAKGYIRGYMMMWDKIVKKAHRDALLEIFK